MKKALICGISGQDGAIGESTIIVRSKKKVESREKQGKVKRKTVNRE
jgi:hypothetical protein